MRVSLVILSDSLSTKHWCEPRAVGVNLIYHAPENYQLILERHISFLSSSDQGLALLSDASFDTLLDQYGNLYVA